MSLAELTLPETDAPRRTVTISPNEESWNTFTELVEEQYGKKMQSAVIDMLVDWFNRNADYNFPVDYDRKPITKVTLSVDSDLWDEFDTKMLRLFSKKKIKSAVISSLVKTYIKDHNKLDL